jgi:hypothetical protein
MRMNFRDLIGGHPLAVLLRLAVISVLVGIVLSLLGVTPHNFLRVLDDFARHVYDLGFGAIQWLIEYLVLGAIVVVPVWLVMRLLRARPKNDA